MKRIACISQKGGVGKSTLARELAVAFAGNGWSARIADMDAKQSTSIMWGQKRQDAGITPEVSVVGYLTVKDAIQTNGVDLAIYDGKPYSDADTRRLAEAADLIVIPSGPSADDLYPQVLLAHELVKAGVPRDRIVFVLNSVTSTLQGAEVTDAKAYVQGAGYRITEAALPRRTAYAQAQNTGRSISEVAHPTLRDHAIKIAEEVGSILMEGKK